jgi:hypothetical protein
MSADNRSFPGFVDAHTHAMFAGDRRAEAAPPAGRRSRMPGLPPKAAGSCRPSPRRVTPDTGRSRRPNARPPGRDAGVRDDHVEIKKRLRPDG